MSFAGLLSDLLRNLCTSRLCARRSDLTEAICSNARHLDAIASPYAKSAAEHKNKLRPAPSLRERETVVRMLRGWATDHRHHLRLAESQASPILRWMSYGTSHRGGGPKGLKAFPSISDVGYAYECQGGSIGHPSMPRRSAALPQVNLVPSCKFKYRRPPLRDGSTEPGR